MHAPTTTPASCRLTRLNFTPHPHASTTSASPFIHTSSQHSQRTTPRTPPGPRDRLNRHGTEFDDTPHTAPLVSAAKPAQTRSWLLVHPAQSGSVFCSPRTSEGCKSDRAANSLLLIASAPQAAGLVGRMAAVISLISPPNPIESKSAQQSGHELAYARSA